MLGDRPIRRDQRELNMSATNLSPHGTEENKSAARDQRSIRSTESHHCQQAPWDLAALASEALNRLRPGHRSETSRRLVFMSFIRENGWRCSFCNADRTVISRQIVFRSADKVVETAHRGNAFANEIDRLCLQQEIATGRGGVWLKLTEEQYKSLCRR